MGLQCVAILPVMSHDVLDLCDHYSSPILHLLQCRRFSGRLEQNEQGGQAHVQPWITYWRLSYITTSFKVEVRARMPWATPVLAPVRVRSTTKHEKIWKKSEGMYQSIVLPWDKHKESCSIQSTETGNQKDTSFVNQCGELTQLTKSQHIKLFLQGHLTVCPVCDQDQHH